MREKEREKKERTHHAMVVLSFVWQHYQLIFVYSHWSLHFWAEHFQFCFLINLTLFTKLQFHFQFLSIAQFPRLHFHGENKKKVSNLLNAWENVFFYWMIKQVNLLLISTCWFCSTRVSCNVNFHVLFLATLTHQTWKKGA